MSSGLLDPFRRNIGVRLGLWYALVFTLSSAAVFTLAYYVLVAAIANKDREVLDARVKEAAVVYQAGGINGLERWVRSQPAQIQNSMFVRLVDRRKEVAFASAPQDWVDFRDTVSDSEGYRVTVPYLRIPQNAERDYTLRSAALLDGSILQIGRTTNS